MDSYHGLHIPEEMLERYSLNQLMEEQLAPIEEHLFICPTCQDCLDAMDEYVHTMKFALASTAKEIRANEITVKNSRWSLAFRQPRLALAWAGALAVLLLVIAVPMRRTDNAQSDVTLSAARGGDSLPIAQARAGANLVLHIDLREIAKAGTYRLELVNASGQSVWRGSAQPSHDQLVVGVPTRLDAGRYWLRLFDSSQPPAVVREYGLELK